MQANPTLSATSEERSSIPFPRFAKKPRKLHMRCVLLPFQNGSPMGTPVLVWTADIGPILSDGAICIKEGGIRMCIAHAGGMCINQRARWLIPIFAPFPARRKCKRIPPCPAALDVISPLRHLIVYAKMILRWLLWRTVFFPTFPLISR